MVDPRIVENPKSIASRYIRRAQRAFLYGSCGSPRRYSLSCTMAPINIREYQRTREDNPVHYNPRELGEDTQRRATDYHGIKWQNAISLIKITKGSIGENLNKYCVSVLNICEQHDVPISQIPSGATASQSSLHHPSSSSVNNDVASGYQEGMV